MALVLPFALDAVEAEAPGAAEPVGAPPPPIAEPPPPTSVAVATEEGM